MTRTRPLALLALVAALSGAPAEAAEIRIGIVQAQAGDARKAQPLLEHLAAKGIQATFVTAPDYAAAADLFAQAKVDAMFGGSGIAGAMILKELAVPLVGAIAAEGPSTYHAVIVAPRGGPRFDGTGTLFAGKRVIFSALASAGEFFFQSLRPPTSAVPLRAASHGAALDALARGQADVAVVKNHVWNKERAKYPGLEQVGEDTGENPDGSLIVSRRLSPELARQLEAVLLALGADASPTATAAKGSLRIAGYTRLTEKEFAHTLDMLRKAGVTKAFAFRF